jgi:hypothetical protein
MGGENLRIPNNGVENYGTIQSLAGAGASGWMNFASSVGTLTNHPGGILRSNGSATSSMLFSGYGGVVNEGVIDVLITDTEGHDIGVLVGDVLHHLAVESEGGPPACDAFADVLPGFSGIHPENLCR